MKSDTIEQDLVEHNILHLAQLLRQRRFRLRVSG